MDTDQRQIEIDLNDLKQIGKQLINSDKQQGHYEKIFLKNYVDMVHQNFIQYQLLLVDVVHKKLLN